MPYNCKGDLYKIEIVKKLQNMGFEVKSVNALNKIMEKMGLLIQYEIWNDPNAFSYNRQLKWNN